MRQVTTAVILIVLDLSKPHDVLPTLVGFVGLHGRVEESVAVSKDAQLCQRKCSCVKIAQLCSNAFV